MRELRGRTAGAEDTRAIAAAVAGHLTPGDVVALTGELGAGKTCFVQGAAAALGVAAPVTSPTFVLVRTYAGRDLDIVHCDVYRLGTLQDVLDLGDEVFAPDVVTFVEWGDAAASLLPPDRLEVVLTHAADTGVDAVDQPRDVLVRSHGARVRRHDALARDLGSWTGHTPGADPAGHTPGADPAGHAPGADPPGYAGGTD